jgi:hypothetical protein
MPCACNLIIESLKEAIGVLSQKLANLESQIRFSKPREVERDSTDIPKNEIHETGNGKYCKVTPLKLARGKTCLFVASEEDGFQLHNVQTSILYLKLILIYYYIKICCLDIPYLLLTQNYCNSKEGS